jgi:hypothetical protein
LQLIEDLPANRIEQVGGGLLRHDKLPQSWGKSCCLILARRLPAVCDVPHLCLAE